MFPYADLKGELELKISNSMIPLRSLYDHPSNKPYISRGHNLRPLF